MAFFRCCPQILLRSVTFKLFTLKDHAVTRNRSLRTMPYCDSRIFLLSSSVNSWRAEVVSPKC